MNLPNTRADARWRRFAARGAFWAIAVAGLWHPLPASAAPTVTAPVQIGNPADVQLVLQTLTSSPRVIHCRVGGFQAVHTGAKATVATSTTCEQAISAIDGYTLLHDTTTGLTGNGGSCGPDPGNCTATSSVLSLPTDSFDVAYAFELNAPSGFYWAQYPAFCSTNGPLLSCFNDVGFAFYHIVS